MWRPTKSDFETWEGAQSGDERVQKIGEKKRTENRSLQEAPPMPIPLGTPTANDNVGIRSIKETLQDIQQLPGTTSSS